MSDILKRSDELGNILVQVQDDLRQLKNSVGRITIHNKGETVDIQALDTAIHRTENGIRRRAEEYLKIVNRHVLTLPSIEETEKKTPQISKWRPALETLPDQRPQRGPSIGASPGQNHKTALTMRLLYNPKHPQNRAVMNQTYGIKFPELQRRTGTTEVPQRVVKGLTVGSLAAGLSGARNTLHLPTPPPEKDTRADLPSLLENGVHTCTAERFSTAVQPKAAPLHRRDYCSSKITLGQTRDMDPNPSHTDPNPSHSQGRSPEDYMRSTLPTYTPPPSAASKRSDRRLVMRGAARLTPLNAQALPALIPVSISNLSFTILEGRSDPMDPEFCRFKQHCCLCWSLVLEELWALEMLLRQYAVPTARVNGARLLELAQGGGVDGGVAEAGGGSDLDGGVAGGGSDLDGGVAAGGGSDLDGGVAAAGGGSDLDGGVAEGGSDLDGGVAAAGGGSDLDGGVAAAGGSDLGGGSGSVARLLSVLENRQEVWELVSRPGQRYQGEGGMEAAATQIQSSWRCYLARAAYLLLLHRKWAAETIALFWLMHSRIKRSLQASRRTHLDNYRIRAQDLSVNWKHIQSSRRTIIHIPSLGYSRAQRLSLTGFDILQNLQMGRLCEVRDDNVDVIYVSPVRLGDDLSQYYTRLIGLHQRGLGGIQGATVGPEDGGGIDNRTEPWAPSSKRFTIITPDALDHFPTHNMCLSSVLKYSPQTLRRIRTLIQGRQAYMVGGVAHVDDLAVADELGVPLLGPEPAVARLYGTKSGGRRVFTSAEVTVPPGQWDIYSLQQLHEVLAQLMTKHMEVRRWLFKMDCEIGGQGTAYCDVSHLSCFTWAQQEYSNHGPKLWGNSWAQEAVLTRYLGEVPDWLSRHAQPVTRSCYPTWSCFRDSFLRQGGVVEAYPPSESVTCLTVDLLLRPDGEVTVLCCGDQLHGSSKLVMAGSTVPQISMCPETLHAVCVRVGKACLSRCITGHVSVDLATFLDPITLEQQLWAIDLDLSYSTQLALTQVMLLMTGGSLDCRTSRLEVPVTASETKPLLRSNGPKLPSVARRSAALGSRLLHSNLSMVHYSVFFQMCKAQGIGFDVKENQGTVFTLHDSCERYSLGMITIGENQQRALLAFARNLSVIHQEISSPNMQGETNFKGLIRNIDNVLGMIVQHKAPIAME
ncbi:hypothetical protein UPYG_G00272910 [Umbra pygmaea]|uniref:IQCH-like ATP-grasp domain-containing protein n=1 Tax=Umbra pygmaea TaxID=75934 RepID=A0ABD0WBD5_UMBPY